MKFKRNADRIERKSRSRVLTITLAVICIFTLCWLHTDNWFVHRHTIRVSCLGNGIYTVGNDTTNYAEFASKMIEEVKFGKEKGLENNIQVYLGKYEQDVHFVDIIMILNALNVNYRLIH